MSRLHARCSHSLLTSLGAVSALALLGACGGDHVDPPLDGATPGDGSACTSCGPISFAVEVMGMDGTPVVMTEGAEIPWAWGFQGGTMIRPQIVFDAADVSEGSDVDVVLRHSPDPAAPDTFGQVSDFLELHQRVPVVTDGEGRLIAGPFDDQIGWTELDGTRLTLEVEVSSVRFATSTRSAAVAIAAMPTNTACEAFALEGDAPGGCPYRVIPGVVVVTSIAPPPAGDYDCEGGVRVMVAFRPDDASAEACAASLPAIGTLPIEHRLTLQSMGFANPPASCLDASGVTIDAELPAVLTLIERGACSPMDLRIDVDLAACEAACVIP